MEYKHQRPRRGWFKDRDTGAEVYAEVEGDEWTVINKIDTASLPEKEFWLHYEFLESPSGYSDWKRGHRR